MDTLNPDSCYPALLARDARFDGRFFVGVTSTGIYCRPICRVRTPRLANCRFFAHAAQAEAAAFRPCMKCRPELAPATRWSAMDATQTLARQAAALIDAGSTYSMAALAERLGITDRHLRRIFIKAHGVTPQQYEQTRRLLLAKQLLTDSDWPVAQLALAAGFQSLRRFNAAFLEHYRMQPTALRRARTLAPEGLSLRLAYRPPYDAAGLLAFVQQRAIPGVELVDTERLALARTLALPHGDGCVQGWVSADFSVPGQVRVNVAPSLWPAVAQLLPRLNAWFDLAAEPEVIAAALGPGAIEGLRLPGAPDRFELAVRAVLGQQVTVAAARTLAARLVNRFGRTLPDAPAGLTQLFPAPASLADVEISDIAELGIIRRRAELIRTLAKAWPQLLFARGEGTVDEATAELQAISGLGEWTAQYMVMRGWAWPDAFPAGDIVLRRALSDDPAQPLSNKACATAGERFRPYRSYAVLQLWRQSI